MDEVEQLITSYTSRAGLSVVSKLGVLIDLEALHDPRALPFLLRVLADRREPTEVRIHVLKRLRNGSLSPANRSLVAPTMLQVISDRSDPELQLQAALALGEFTDIEGVPTTLGRLALDLEEPIDLRYSAFTSLQRAGPTPECVELLRQLTTDEMLGRSARSLLSAWRLE
jgi:HEAT repeat protein